MSKRTFQPNNRRRAKTHGFRLRMRTRAGRAILAARRSKKRIAMQEMQDATERIMLGGPERRSRVMTPRSALATS